MAVCDLSLSFVRVTETTLQDATHGRDRVLLAGVAFVFKFTFSKFAEFDDVGKPSGHHLPQSVELI